MQLHRFVDISIKSTMSCTCNLPGFNYLSFGGGGGIGGGMCVYVTKKIRWTKVSPILWSHQRLMYPLTQGKKITG